MILSQVTLLWLVKLWTNWACLALKVVLNVCLGQVMLLFLKQTLWSHSCQILSVLWLFKSDYLFAGRMLHVIHVIRWEESLINGDESTSVTFTKLHRSFLGCNVSNRLLLSSPSWSLTNYSIIARRVVLVLWETWADVKVRHLVFLLASQLGLSPASLTKTFPFVKASLRVVHSRMLSKNEVSCPELIDWLSSLLLSVELTSLWDAVSQLALNADVCHLLQVFSVRFRSLQPLLQIYF